MFRLETDRVIGNDWVVRYENRFLQVQRQAGPYAPAKAKVVVCEWEDGRLEIRYRGQKVAWKEIAERPRPRATEPPRKTAKPYGGTPPTAGHPWKQRYDGMPVQSLLGRRSGQAPIALASRLRYALSARPTASQGFASAEAGAMGEAQHIEGDISNELRQATF